MGATAETAPTVFLFPGVGDHYPGMAAGLYDRAPVFRAALDACAGLFTRHLGEDIRDHLYPADARPPAAATDAGGGLDLAALMRPAAHRPIDATRIAQPVMFTVGYALAAELAAAGVRPATMVGHSLGEYVAACRAGVFSLADAVAVVARRAALLDQAPAGAMCVVLLGRDRLTPHLGDGLWLAAVDGPSMCVISGHQDAVADLEAWLAEQGVAHRRLVTRTPFHTPLLARAAAEFRAVLAGVPMAPPTIPIVSNVTGTWLTDQQATDPGYWADHICQPVLFADAVAELWALGSPVLVEVGPGGSLGALAAAHPDRPADATILPTLPGPRTNRPDLAMFTATVRALTG